MDALAAIKAEALSRREQLKKDKLLSGVSRTFEFVSTAMLSVKLRQCSLRGVTHIVCSLQKRTYFKRSQLESVRQSHEEPAAVTAKQRRRSSGEGMVLNPDYDENDDLPDISEAEVER